MCARFGRGSAVVVCACRCACRLDLANIHRHAHHSSRRRWSCGATGSDMKRTCATCHEYSRHTPFVSSNSMVVVTNGGHSRSGQLNRHVHRFAPFLGLIGAGGPSAHRACEQDAVLKLGCDVYLVQFRGRGDKPWPFLRVAPFLIFVHSSPFLSLVSCPPASPSIMPLAPPCH